LLPAVAILTAGMLVVLMARRGAPSRHAPVADLDDQDAERLRTEMQRLDEAEGPDW
jgi:hypothetical protein